MKKTGQIIAQNISLIIKTWEEQVKKEILSSKNMDVVILQDHLRYFIKDISDVMTRYSNPIYACPDEKYIEIFENCSQHGKHRALSSNYTVDQIILEYIIFNRVLTEVLILNNVYTLDVGELLKYFMELATLKSVEAFSKSIQDMQEKLVGTLAHDIRNPLSIAKTSLELLDCQEGEDLVSTMKYIAIKSVTKSLGLIESLMDAITVKAGQGIMLEFAEINIFKIINEIYKDSETIYFNEFEFKYTSDNIVGIFDGTAIRRLIENLISNAVKYGLYKSPITINIKDLGEAVELSIHNYGKPIPKERQGQIFQFLKKDNDSIQLNSWGMGLTLVKIVAEAHGGYVNLESDTINGTRFTILMKKSINKPGKKRIKL